MATEKQLKRVKIIIDYFGYEDIKQYADKYFKDVDMEKLTKKQA